MEITKSDWKLYRERVGDWQEHYMEKLLKRDCYRCSTCGKSITSGGDQGRK